MEPDNKLRLGKVCVSFCMYGFHCWDDTDDIHYCPIQHLITIDSSPSIAYQVQAEMSAAVRSFTFENDATDIN